MVSPIEEEFKKLCQIFTPKKNVEQMINWCNYSKNLYGKKVVENSFGEGNILEEIVIRYIKDCMSNGLDNEIIREGLNNDIYGYEIDEVHYKTCIKKLNKILEDYNLDEISWEHIYLEDALVQQQEDFFDYVIRKPTIYKI